MAEIPLSPQPDFEPRGVEVSAPPDEPIDIEAPTERSLARSMVGMLVIVASVSMVLGHTLKTPSLFGPNDISRWCTVWALLEHGSYAIEECPWQYRTQDKVYRSDKLEKPDDKASPLQKYDYMIASKIAPESWKTGDAEKHYYSSKPPLLPTMVAGILYPFRKATGVELHRVTEEKRGPRNVEKPIEGQPGKFEKVTETDREPVKWPVYVYYFKPILILFNVVPFLVFLVLLARFLDRHASNDWAWFFVLFSAAWATYLFAYNQTLNNHTIAAYSAFFALYPFLRIWSDGRRGWGYFASSGLFGGFCACNELPAALFGLLLFLLLVFRFPKKTLLFFVPVAVVPIAAFLVTQFLAFGQFVPVYEEFGTKSYEYEGSYWNTPLEFDWYNRHPEPKEIYLMHMTVGHHGVYSLTPIYLLALLGLFRNLFERRRKMVWPALLTLVLTVAMFALYTFNPKARNYGGSAQGLRWLFWLIPFWLLMLPPGVEMGQDRKWFRWLALLLLAISVLSVGFALRTPWSHPWMVEVLERSGLLHLHR